MLLAAVLAATAFGGTGAQAAKQIPAAELLRTALSDASARSSVHEAETFRTATVTDTFSDDVANTGGRQDIVQTGGIDAHVLIAGGFAYFSGDITTLVKYFGFSSTEADAVDGRWVSVPSLNAGYATVADDATLPSALHDITPTGRLAETATTHVDGVAAVGIRGTLNLAATSKTTTYILYVSMSGKPLPLRATLVEGRGASATFSFTRWGEHISLQAPTNVVSIDSLEK